MKVANRKCIRRLSLKSMRAAKSRNLIAILAIALTTILFTSLFTIALSINHSVQQANFRQVGTYAHGGFKYLSWQQVEELHQDPLIRSYGLRLHVGMPLEEPFHKAHVEVSYCDETMAGWMYTSPQAGRLPQEGSMEAATDTRVLALLGLEPQLGQEFSLSFDVDGQPTTQAFTLSGWWEYDGANVASHLLIPQSRAEQILTSLDTQSLDGRTGTWNMDVMFGSSLQIEQNIAAVLEHHGYQNERYAESNYLATGVNWGYTGSQLYDSIDPVVVIGIAALLLLILLTGYLIIFNVFQISVSNDIRFYGLLKTIGTTGRQLKRLIRGQALVLSGVGIPLGLLGGYLIGARLTPLILARLNGVVADAISASPLIFLLSALFSLITVLISCRRPGRMAARVSPVEAVRYTEAGGGKRTLRPAQKGASLAKLAWANLGRNRRKTAFTIVSLSLAVVLLNLTVTFTGGFDMNKYLRNMVADFVLADAGYFQVGGDLWNIEMALEEQAIAEIQAQGGLSGGGRTYGLTSAVQQFVPEDYFRAAWGVWYSEETLDWLVSQQQQADGRVYDAAQLFGMERFVLDKLELLDGDLSKLYQPGGRYLAAVYRSDNYGNPYPDSHWAQLGEVVTLRYVEEFEYYDVESGEILAEIPDDGRSWASRPKTYREIDYEVVALVSVPNSLSYRYYGRDEFVLNDQTFIQDSGTDQIMYYAFDTEEDSEAAMETFLREATSGRLAQYDYESKETYAQEFESMRQMFLILGGLLSFIIGLVGMLNFLNAVLTGILARRREFAVLQAIGMTGKQLKRMLIWEGMWETVGSLLLSLLLCLALFPLLHSTLERVFWFFSYRVTLLPILAVAPVFALLGIGLPLLSYRLVARRSLIERLREAEM